MRLLFYLAAIVAAASSAAISSKQEASRKTVTSPTLNPLGEVDGKIYYVDFQYMAWQAAVSHCHGLGDNFQLATITTTAQMDFLSQAFKEKRYSEDFWTGGRDARGPRQYTWDPSGDQVTPVVYFFSSPWYQTCLVLRPTPNNGTKVHAVHCEKNRLAVLCEEYCGVDC